MTTYSLAKALGIKIDYVFHVNTGTGIKETTDYVRETFAHENYYEPHAGSAYEDYVMRKGFIGRGHSKAHPIAWHLLKAGPYRKAVSKLIRKGRRNRPVLLLNGARKTESANRSLNLKDEINPDSKTPNYWVNLIHHWSDKDCQDFLLERKVKQNPVSKKMCRSGECMCGTMQSKADRAEASVLFPEWKEWIDNLEQKVMQKFPWGWGDDVPKWWQDVQSGQYDMFFKEGEPYMPMCGNCSVKAEDNS